MMKEIRGGEPLKYEERLRTLEASIMLVTTDSPVFQAFADLSDGLEIFDRYTRSVDGKGNHDMLETMELTAVYETNRKRQNEPAGFKGYRAAFKYFQQESDMLETAPGLNGRSDEDKR